MNYLGREEKKFEIDKAGLYFQISVDMSHLCKSTKMGVCERIYMQGKAHA